jgi:hypothetical protein
VSPVMVAVSGTAIHLRPNRPWLLIGVLAFHGLAEESSRGATRSAVVHAAIDTFKLVVIPTAALPTYSLLIIVVSLTIPLLALARPRQALMLAPIPGARHEPDRAVGGRRDRAGSERRVRRVVVRAPALTTILHPLYAPQEAGGFATDMPRFLPIARRSPTNYVLVSALRRSS